MTKKNRYVKEGHCEHCLRANDRHPNRKTCSDCAVKISNNRKNNLEEKRVLRGDKKKNCIECREWKWMQSFRPTSTTEDGRSLVCDECRKGKHKENLRWCHGCSEFRSTSEFFARGKSGATYGRCVYCMNGYKFGISGKEYKEKLECQGGVCPGCESTEGHVGRALCLDHDHETGELRDFLCNRCNTIIGLANDDQNLLHRLIAYLDKHAKRYKILAE